MRICAVTVVVVIVIIIVVVIVLINSFSLVPFPYLLFF